MERCHECWMLDRYYIIFICWIFRIFTVRRGRQRQHHVEPTQRSNVHLRKDSLLVLKTWTIRFLPFSLYLAVRAIFASAVFLTYPIQFYVPIEIVSKFIDERCRDKKRNSLFYEYLARFLMVSFTCKNLDSASLN